MLSRILRQLRLSFAKSKSPPPDPFCVSDQQEGSVLGESKDCASIEGVVFDEGLLERARSQWEFGDWDSLLKIDLDVHSEHPDRAKLALLVAEASIQSGRSDKARKCIELARRWGCPRRLIAQVLVSGVTNTLGRCEILNGQDDKALGYFRDALNTASSGDARLLARARSAEQAQLIRIEKERLLDTVSSNLLVGVSDDRRAFNEYLLAKNADPSVKADLREALSLRSLQAIESVLSSRLSSVSGANNLGQVRVSEFMFRDARILVAGVRGDYIPEKISTASSFYEGAFLEVLEKFHDGQGVILDVGANIGNHVVFFSKIMGAQVIGIEPVPASYFLLQANCILNGVEDRVSVLKLAAGATESEIELEMRVGNNTGSYTAKYHDGAGEAQTVGIQAKVVPLDSIFIGLRISIIKIDVEGMELEVLLGAKGMIQNNLPLISAECFTRAEFDAIEGFLAPMGYTAIELANPTPTFIFVNTFNAVHMKALTRKLHDAALQKASKNEAFREH